MPTLPRIAAIVLPALVCASAALAQQTPADLLRQRLERDRPTQTQSPQQQPQQVLPQQQSDPYGKPPAAGAPVAAMPQAAPAPMAAPPQQPGAVAGRAQDFDSTGYRQPDLMRAFVLRRIDRPLPMNDAAVRAYAFHLVATAKQACPFVDDRLALGMASSATGGNLGTEGGLERLGIQGIMQMGEMLTNPDRFMAGAMRAAAWEGDARADIMTFMQRHGCTNDINIPLAGALHFHRNPPSQIQAQMVSARSAAQRSCNTQFDGGEATCACLDRLLGTRNLSLEDWQALGTSYDVMRLPIPRRELAAGLRQCRG